METETKTNNECKEDENIKETKETESSERRTRRNMKKEEREIYGKKGQRYRN